MPRRRPCGRRRVRFHQCTTARTAWQEGGACKNAASLKWGRSGPLPRVACGKAAREDREAAAGETTHPHPQNTPQANFPRKVYLINPHSGAMLPKQHRLSTLFGRSGRDLRPRDNAISNKTAFKNPCGALKRNHGKPGHS